MDRRPLRVLVIGLGRMGLPIAAHLVRAGHDVTAVDVRTGQRVLAEQHGIRWGGPVAVLDDVDTVLTVLPGSPELRQLMLGTTSTPGLASQLGPGIDWLDLTSTAPELGAELAADAAGRGAGQLDCGLAGGPDEAWRGELGLYVGGDVTVLDRNRHVLKAFCDADRIRHVGPSGSGHLAKLLINLLWFGQAVATAEALLLGQAAGIAPATLSAVLADSAAGSEYVRTYLPRLLDGDYLTSFGLDRCAEELDSIECAADAAGVPFELSSLVSRLHRDALAEFGPVDGELMAVALLEARAGRTLRKG